MNSCFEIDNDNDEAFEVVEEFYPEEPSPVGYCQLGHSQNSLGVHNVTSIEQGLRQSVTAVS